jgi:hypothetical protein
MKTFEERFWGKVDKTPTCWLWTAAKVSRGYGIITGGSPAFKQLSAHRVSYELANGLIPEGLVIDHLCRVKACVKPTHLEAVPQSVNVARGDSPMLTAQRNRQKAKLVCKRNHELTLANTYTYPDGGRECRECRRLNRIQEKIT